MSAIRIPAPRVRYPHVVISVDGEPMIEGSTVPVRQVFAWHRQGIAVEVFLRRYSHLGPARIFSALAFAYDNLELMTAVMSRELLKTVEQKTAPVVEGRSGR